MRKKVLVGAATAVFAFCAGNAYAIGGMGGFMSPEASPYALWEPQTVLQPNLPAATGHAVDQDAERREQRPPPQPQPKQKTP